MAHANETSPKQPTDREELQRHLASVFEEIDAYLAETDEGKSDELREHLAPLCFMRHVVHTIQLAWGGPEYGFKLTYDPESREWLHGLFYYRNWFTHEEQPLSPEELNKVLDAYSMDCFAE
jgi:hypothetical protein